MSNSNRLKYTYGITINDYDNMVIEQNNKCALCGKDYLETDNGKKGRRFCIDHNHDTEKVRALLCINCNTGLGNFKEDILILKEAIRYIKKHNHGGG